MWLSITFSCRLEYLFWDSHQRWKPPNMRYSSPACHKHIKGRAIKSFWHNDTFNSPITPFNCMVSVKHSNTLKWYHSYLEFGHLFQFFTLILKTLDRKYFHVFWYHPIMNLSFSKLNYVVLTISWRKIRLNANRNIKNINLRLSY